jgi:hypothetical protein
VINPLIRCRSPWWNRGGISLCNLKGELPWVILRPVNIPWRSLEKGTGPAAIKLLCPRQIIFLRYEERR